MMDMMDMMMMMMMMMMMTTMRRTRTAMRSIRSMMICVQCSLLMLEVCRFSFLFASLCASFDLLGAAGSPRATAWFDALVSKGEHI